MNSLQASMKDRSAKKWRQNRTMYRIGSYFKGCENCGEKILVETASGREVVRFKSGYDVFRAYEPSVVGWTFWCWTCGAKDLVCWPGEKSEFMLGRPPDLGCRTPGLTFGDGAKKQSAYALHQKEVKMGGKATVVRAQTAHELAEDIRRYKIAKLEKEVARLQEILKGGK